MLLDGQEGLFNEERLIAEVGDLKVRSQPGANLIDPFLHFLDDSQRVGPRLFADLQHHCLAPIEPRQSALLFEAVLHRGDVFNPYRPTWRVSDDQCREVFRTRDAAQGAYA